jgi:ATP-dependent Clp protease ATP-binding subunit ClpC
MRLERFTEKAQEAFQEAQEIMHEQHHTQLDVEHIFLAMLRQRDGLTGRALERLGVDVEMVTQRVERELE